MKRQKRDRLERARAKGYQAGLAGRSKEACPYMQADTRGYWFGGWRDASEEQSGGALLL
ncbi:ribosome modulation factor [Celerinatantimonas sp. MCCC 1A17872]|uniref:ribosome modulation factor n=1 Tax=Celerinatantimonas sp. MCCC 1A17872 TaxID=3177514 RepID=UPI0038BF6A6F